MDSDVLQSSVSRRCTVRGRMQSEANVGSENAPAAETAGTDEKLLLALKRRRE